MSEITKLDQKIMRLAAYKSPVEISETMGGTLSPEEIASRTQEILASRDWLTVMQRKQMLLYKLEEIVDRYFDWAMDGSVASFKGVVLPAIQEIRKLVAEDRESLEEFMLRISDSHAERMGMGFAAGFQYVIEHIKSDPERDADELVLEAVPIAMKKVDADMEEVDATV